MSFNGTGTYSPPAADFPAVTLTTISSPHFNNTINDMSTGLSNAVTRDGQSPWTANLPAGGFKLTGLNAGTLRTDSTRPAEVQDGGYTWGGTAGGTANALTFTLTPAITAYVAGQMFRFKAGASANTAAVTLAINGLTATAVQLNGAALVANDILANQWYEVLHDGAVFQIHRLGFNSNSGFTTGDVKATIKTTADTGWIVMNDGTLGNAASGGTTRANADTEALFTLLWNNTANAQCAVSTGRGANAAADFAANKNIGLPKALGRALAIQGSGSGLTARVMAQILGDENPQAHNHTGSGTTSGHSTDHSHGYTAPGTGNTATGGGDAGLTSASSTGGVNTDHTHTYSFTSSTSGTGGAGNMQPSFFISIHMKL